MKYKIEWDEYENQWVVDHLNECGIMQDCEFFDDLASAQEYKEKQEANDGK